MGYSPLQNALMLFLDPAVKVKKWHWYFVKEKFPAADELLHQIKERESIVLCFDRLEILNYWSMCWKLAFFNSSYSVRSFFLIKDKYLYHVVNGKDSKAYQALCKVQNSNQVLLNNNQTYLFQLLKMVLFRLPFTTRALQRYIVISTNTTDKSDLPFELSDMNYMFFPDVEKKLFMTNSNTLLNGKGTLIKTTANIAYESILKNEYDITACISKLCSKAGLLPEVIGRVELNGKNYYCEEYVVGKPLRIMFQNPKVYNSPVIICDLLDRLDSWYEAYRSRFSGPKLSLQDLYAPVINGFCHTFSGDREQCDLAVKTEQLLIKLSCTHSGLVPVTAHNDLWPANFLVTSRGLFAVDWERAVENRSELFDYFWMIISATMEYLSAPYGFEDFSRWFQRLLISKDSVCSYARVKLEKQLQLNDIAPVYFDLFIVMFLMELTMQGKAPLHQMAAEELKSFARKTKIFEE